MPTEKGPCLPTTSHNANIHSKLVFYSSTVQAPSENAVVRTVLSTIGALAAVSHSAFRPYVAEVMPLVIDAIQDTGSARKRVVAVKTLGQVTHTLAQHAETSGHKTEMVVQVTG